MALDQIMRLHKTQVNKYVTRKMYSQYPDYGGRVTSKLVNDCLIYLQGYADAIKKDIMPPYNKQDIQQLLLDQGFDYILSRIQSS